MRTALTALWITTTLAATALGQSGPYLATVTKSGVQLHVNPTNQSLATETLKEGTQVLVDHEEDNGMLAVQPSPGSNHCLSWVQVQFVEGFDPAKPTPQNVTVTEDTTLAPGEIGSAVPNLYYRKTQVPRGTILTVIGLRATATDGDKQKSFYPVLPPAGDFRYVARDAVKVLRPANTSFTIHDNPGSTVAGSASSSGITPASASIPPQTVAMLPAIGPPTPAAASGGSTAAVASPPAPSKPVVNNPLWAQAEAAEQEGRLMDAEKYYFQLARLMNEPGGDRDTANLCYTRIHSIREKQKAGATPPTAPGGKSMLINPGAAGNVSVAATPGLTQVQTDGGALRPATASSGKLVLANVWVTGRTTYQLEASPGVTVAYVVAGDGVNLERFVNRRVDITGPTSTRKDLSKPLIVAMGVEEVK